MSCVSFRPREDDEIFRTGLAIVVLVIDEERGLELRIHRDGRVSNHELTQGVAHYRASPLWEEVSE